MSRPHELQPKRSIQRQLMFGVAAILALITSIFIADLVRRHRAFVGERTAMRVLNLARVTASASVDEVLAGDHESLRQVLQALQPEDGVHFAMFLDTHGRVLARSQAAPVDQWPPPLEELQRLPEQNQEFAFWMGSTAVVAAAPVLLQGKPIGWYVVANDLSTQAEFMAGLVRQALLHALLAIAVGCMLAALLARRITRPLHLLLEGARRFATGAPYVPVPLTTENEVGVVTQVFNNAVATVDRQRRELEEHNRFMREVADSLPVQISYVDAEERYGFNNRAYFDWFGKEPAELLGKTVRETVGEAAYANAAEHIHAALKGERVSFEHIINTPRRPARQVRVHYIPHVGAGGEVLGFFALIFDVTESNLAQQQIKESEERFRTLADSSPVMIWMSDPDQHRSYFNKTWLDFTGCELQTELEGGWLRQVHPRDLEAVQEADLLNHRAQRSFAVQFRLRRGDGEYRWLLNSGAPRFSADGRYLGHIGSAVDITSRKEIEEELLAWKNRYEAAVRASDQLLYDWNPATNTIAWAGDTERILGLPPEQIGDELGFWMKLIHPDDRVRFEEGKRLSLKGGTLRLQYRLMRSDGRHIHVEDRGDFIRDGDGSTQRMIGFVEDITDRKVAEFMLQGLTETLEKRVAERTAEAEQRASDLRMMAIELTQAEQRERRRMAQVLHDDLQQLVAVAKLRLGRLRTGEWNDNGTAREIVDQTDALLAEVIQTARTLSVDLSPPILQDRGLGAALEWLGRKFGQEQELLVHVEVEEDVSSNELDTDLFLLQAVRELLFNIVKHAQTAEAWVCARRQGDAAIEVFVEDRGCGFEPSDADLRGSSEHFGLFNIRQRISFLGGVFRLESKPDGGTRVNLNLPRSLPTPVVESPVDHSETRTSRAESELPLEKVRILVVDDHQIVRQGLAGLLSGQKDFEVVAEAPDGATAVQLVSEVLPAVIIMDVSMPGMNGIEATRAIHKQHPEIAIIGLSMHEAQDMARAMRDAGAAAYLSKDGAAQVLIETVRSLGSRGEPELV